MALKNEQFYKEQIWPRWIDNVRRSPQRIIFMHGIMGSELFERNQDETRWLDIGVWREVDDLEYKSLSPDGSVDINGQNIYARSTVKPPIFGDYYKEIKNAEKLRPGTFNFDWRESIPIEATRLKQFMEILLEDGKPVTFVTHSMGGSVLLYFLSQYPQFDDFIKNIIFTAPPFHGALKPLRIIEDGNGAPVDWLVRNNVLRNSAATTQGLFHLLVAPRNLWNDKLPLPDGGEVKLKYPVCNGDDLYIPNSWNNKHRFDLRQKILDYSNGFYSTMLAAVPNILNTRKLKDKIHVIVGLNGKTAYAAQRQSGDGEWVIHKPKKVANGKYANGDGTVLFQSSYLPGLDMDRYWALIRDNHEKLHGGISNEPEVLDAISSIIDSGTPQGCGLVEYKDFVGKIDWEKETRKAKNPAITDDLCYLERERMRADTPKSKWGKALNPGGKDAERFHLTRNAALRALEGGSVSRLASLAGEDREFLVKHIKSMMMPMHYG